MLPPPPPPSPIRPSACPPVSPPPVRPSVCPAVHSSVCSPTCVLLAIDFNLRHPRHAGANEGLAAGQPGGVEFSAADRVGATKLSRSICLIGRPVGWAGWALEVLKRSPGSSQVPVRQSCLVILSSISVAKLERLLKIYYQRVGQAGVKGWSGRERRPRSSQETAGAWRSPRRLGGDFFAREFNFLLMTNCRPSSG